MIAPERLTLRSIMTDFVRDFSQAERGLWGAFVQLTLRPRRVIETFLYKDRQQFSRPTRYLIFCLSVAALQLLLVQGRYGSSLYEYQMDLQNHELALQIDPVSEFARGFKEGFEGGSNNSIEEIKAYSSYSSYLLATLIPVFAFGYFMVFPARKFNFAETLAGSVYLHGHQLLVMSLGTLPLLLFGEIADYVYWASWVKWGALLLLVISVFRVFLVSRRDAAWLIPKILLTLVWAATAVLVIGILLGGLLAAVFSAEKAILSSGAFWASVLIFAGLTLGVGRLLYAFRAGWPRWYWWVPMMTISVLFYGSGVWALLSGLLG